jgi:hypothetical protein
MRGGHGRPAAIEIAPGALTSLETTVADQGRMLSLLFARLEAAPVPQVIHGFDGLAGAWLSTWNGTHAYVEVTDKPRFVYCYEGDDVASGEYYGFRRYGDDLMGRFRWFHAEIDGYFWMHFDAPDRLTGAWWMTEELSMDERRDLALLKQARKMNAIAFVRTPGKRVPAWATEALAALRRGGGRFQGTLSPDATEAIDFADRLAS